MEIVEDFACEAKFLHFLRFFHMFFIYVFFNFSMFFHLSFFHFFIFCFIFLHFSSFVFIFSLSIFLFLFLFSGCSNCKCSTKCLVPQLLQDFLSTFFLKKKSFLSRLRWYNTSLGPLFLFFSLSFFNFLFFLLSSVFSQEKSFFFSIFYNCMQLSNTFRLLGVSNRV